MNRSNDSSRTVAELRDELLGFTHPSAVRRIASAVRSADEVQALYALLSAGEEPLAYRAAWTLCHLAPTWDAVLRDRYDELVAAALDCPHAGRRRLLLALLYRQPQPEPLRVDFLDFCLDAMTDPAQPHAVRMYCMKLACEMCRTQKDLDRAVREAQQYAAQDAQLKAEAVANSGRWSSCWNPISCRRRCAPCAATYWPRSTATARCRGGERSTRRPAMSSPFGKQPGPTFRGSP